MEEKNTLTGKEAIIEKIISDASVKAQELEKEGDVAIEKQRIDAEKFSEEYFSVQKEILKDEVEKIVERRKTVAEIEVKKILLSKKQEIIEEVLKDVYNKLSSLKKDEYLGFIEKLLNLYAEKGDKVILSSDNVIKETDVSGLKVVKDKDLKIELGGKFKGGVYLTGKTCDKDLTFQSLIDEKREEFSVIISEKLFNK